MAESNYTAPNDFRAFCEFLGETEASMCHHGIKGQKWGVRRYQNTDGTLTSEGRKHYEKGKTNYGDPQKLVTQMTKNIKYSEFTKLKNHDEVERTKTGDCHSQVMYEYVELKRLGLKPKAKFFIEYSDGSNNGGTTHSFVYYSQNGKVYWLENAWESQRGLHAYNNVQQMVKDVEQKHWAENPDSSFTKLAWGNFHPELHKSGDTLQNIVDMSLKGGFQNGSRT